MFFQRLFLLFLGFFALKKVFSWISGAGSRAGVKKTPSATGESQDPEEILSDQGIEEAEFEELPQDRP